MYSRFVDRVYILSVAGEWGEAVPPPQQISTPGIESVAATGWQ